jgi:hypothetical protein
VGSIIQFREIRICFPQRYLQKLFPGHQTLSAEDARKLRALLSEIEATENKLQHLRSVVETLLLRHVGSNG